MKSKTFTIMELSEAILKPYTNFPMIGTITGIKNAVNFKKRFHSLLVEHYESCRLYIGTINEEELFNLKKPMDVEITTDNYVCKIRIWETEIY